MRADITELFWLGQLTFEYVNGFRRPLINLEHLGAPTWEIGRQDTNRPYVSPRALRGDEPFVVLQRQTYFHQREEQIFISSCLHTKRTLDRQFNFAGLNDKPGRFTGPHHDVAGLRIRTAGEDAGYFGVRRVRLKRGLRSTRFIHASTTRLEPACRPSA